MSDKRLPLPGEKPISVWRPRQKQPRPWHRTRAGVLSLLVRLSLRLLPWVGAALAVLVGIAVWRATATPVTVVLNGQPVSLRTHRQTVGGAARAAGVRPDDTLYLSPPAGTRLEAGMIVTIAHRRPVIVHVDGQTLIASSHETDPRAIVEGLGIDLGPADVVRVERAVRPAQAEVAADPALAQVPPLPREVRVVRPVRVIVNQSGERVAFDTTAPTLGQALA